MQNPTDAPPDTGLVLAELARLLGHADFAHAPTHQRLLRHVVERTLAGQGAELKESLLGIEVFHRPADRFDPTADSIVRVEARRLRQRLAQHYGSAGAGAALRIDLPKGTYKPRFVAVRRDPCDPRVQAHELVQRGNFFLREGHESGHRRALARFEAAVLADPTLPDGHVGVARAWLQLVATSIEPPLPGVERALQAAHAALGLQPGQPEALALCAQLEQRFRFDWVAASGLFRRAVAAAPQSAYVRHAHAFGLMLQRSFDAARSELQVARSLDPLHLGLRAHEALLHLYRREWEAAQDALDALLDLSPGNVLAQALSANVSWLAGNAEAAWAGYQAVARDHPTLSIGLAGSALVRASQGRLDESDALVGELRTQMRGRYLPPYQLAMIACAGGRADAAIDLLQQAVDERDPNAVCLPVDPCFDRLATHPRFQVLVDTVLGTAMR